MNILHMKYAVEVAKAGSISKASETLLVAQPNLSRSIKELEASLGISIFDRSAKGMFLTHDGEEFIGYAQKILQQIDEVERLYNGSAPVKQRLSVSVPRSSYMSQALAQLSLKLTDDEAEIFYKETNSSRTIKNVLSSDFKLGIIRYAENYDHHFKEMLEDKNLAYKQIAEFQYVLVMNRNSPLAALDEIHFSDLPPFIEVAHADPYVPSLPLAIVKKQELPNNINRRIYVYERASQFDLMAQNNQTFMWMSPVPDILLQRYDLIQRVCPDNQRKYRDVLIHRKDYRLTDLDKEFIRQLASVSPNHG